MTAVPGPDACGCPVRDDMVYHQRGTCTDPAVAALDWYADGPAQQAVTTARAPKPKYLVFRTDGTDIPEGEPCWVFRAKDALALAAIVAYRAMAEGVALPPEFLADIDAHIDRIKRWQETYGAKLPD